MKKEKKSEQMPSDTKLRCGWCGGESEASKWNEESKLSCFTREMRKAFVEIYNIKLFRKGAKSAWFCCPHCKMWSKATTIRVIAENEELKGLGCEKLIKTVSKRRNNGYDE